MFGWAQWAPPSPASCSPISILRLPFESLVWAKGIEGERKAAEYLAPLEADGFIVLNNRRIPGSKGDIDHIVIGPTGIFPIETKNWSGRLAVRNDRLFVGEQDRTWALEQLYREALAVQVALNEELTRHRVTVTPILCAIGGADSRSSVGRGRGDLRRSRSGEAAPRATPGVRRERGPRAR